MYLFLNTILLLSLRTAGINSGGKSLLFQQLFIYLLNINENE